MKDSDIIRAVAEFGGWEHGHWVEYAATSGDPTRLVLIGRQWSHDKATGPGREVRNSMPDFLTSLDAIMPVCEKLGFVQKIEFAKHISSITDDRDDSPMTFLRINATARQRCEALLRTIGKWREE